MPTTMQHTDEVAISLAGSLIRCHNNMDHPFVEVYAGQRYTVPAGGDLIIPIEAMWDWAGRPWVIDRDHRKERTEELARLKTRYGVFSDNDPRVERTEEDAWAANVPNLTFMELETGNPYTTVLDDPTGATVTPADTTYQEKAALEARYEDLQQQVKALSAALAQTELRNYVPSADSVEEDTPQKVPVKDSDPPATVGRRGRGGS